MAINVGQRHVLDTPRNNTLYALDKARDLTAHTLKICSNKNIFSEEYSYLTQKLVDTSLDIYLMARRANNIKVTNLTERNHRRFQQDVAISESDELLALIDLAKRVFHLKSNKVNFWIAMVEETKMLLCKMVECYESWRSHIAKGNSYKLLSRMDRFYFMEVQNA